MNTKIENLKGQLSELRDTFFKGAEVRKDALEKYRSIEQQIKEENKKIFLSNYNKTHQKKRELAKVIFEIEKISIEDITNDCKVNKQKIKKYPNYFKLEYCFFETWQNLVHSVKYKGEKFKLYFYDGAEQKEIKTFEELLKYNHIQEKDVTMKEYKKILNDLEKAQQRVKNEIEKYNTFKKDFYFFNVCGLIGQKDETTYFFTEKHY